MDWTALQVVTDIAWKAGTVLLGLWVWSDRRQRATRAQIDRLGQDVDASLDKIEPRLAAVELEIRHLPQRSDLPCGQCDGRVTRLEESSRHQVSRADLGQLHARLDDLGGQVARLAGGLEKTEHTLTLIHQHLLDK